MQDDIIIKANNTDSLLRIIKDNLFKITGNLKLQQQNKLYIDNILFNKSLFGDEEFRDTEYIFYKYLQYIPQKIRVVISQSLQKNINAVQEMILVLIIGFVLLIATFILYLYCIFTNDLINLLSISRYILKIVTTISLFFSIQFSISFELVIIWITSSFELKFKY